MRKGIIGSDNLNRTLQQAVNSQAAEESAAGWRQFLINDKVMQIRNNYDKEVFNGDIGFVTAKNEGERTDRH